MRIKGVALALLVAATLALSLPIAAETIIGGIDMGITKDVDASQAAPGDTLVYTLVATNFGEAGAREGYVTDVLPDGVTFVSVNDPACTHNAGVIECYYPLWLPTVLDPVAGVKTVQITVTVDADASGTLVNLARVENRDPAEGAPEDGDPSNDEDTAETVVLQQEPGEIGDTVFEDPNGNGVQDAGEPGIPGVNVRLEAAGGGVQLLPTDANGNYLFTDLAALDYTVTLEETSLPGGFAYTTASQFDVPLADGQSFLDADFGIVFPDEAVIDLELTKTVTPTELIGAEDLATFTVTVTNQGPDDASGVVVKDTLPSELVLIGGFGGDGSAGAVGGPPDPTEIFWTIGDVAAGETKTLTFDARVLPASGTFTNVAEVTEADQPDADSTPGDGQGDDFDTAVVERAEVLPSNGSIGDTVYLDSNNNGVQDAGEPGISGATLTLVSSSVSLSKVTDSNGTYLFDALPPDDYTVTVDQNTVGEHLSITTASSFLVTLADDEVFLNADFGFTPIIPATGAPGDVLVLVAGLLLLLGAAALVLGRRLRRAR